MIQIISLLFKLWWLSAVSIAHSHLFYTADGEETLLRWVQTAEQQLKIFLYPQTNNPEATMNQRTHPNFQHSIPVETHFMVEKMFPHYLRQLQRSGSGHPMVVEDPAKANAFIIDHHWIVRGSVYLVYSNCSNFYSRHMYPVINNVVDKYPYFNRSNGADHFFIAVYDNGVWSSAFPHPPCYHPRCHGPNASHAEVLWNRMIFNRIRTANFITNYAKDEPFRMEFASRREHIFDEKTFITGQDITIPQPLEASRVAESHLKRPWIVNRKYDSSFTGTIWGHRDMLVNMSRTHEGDYDRKGTERFIHRFSEGSYKFGGKRLHRYSYFTYNACGLGYCWSQRLYDGLLSQTIPVLIGSDLIMPFERFINWRNISIKMNAPTWQNISGALDRYRNRMRGVGDQFRSKLAKFWSELGVDRNQELYMRPEFLTNTSSVRSARLLRELKNTLIWQKMEYISQVKQWLVFDKNSYPSPAELNSPQGWRHPFRLLQLEMWCRVSSYESRKAILHHDRADDLCLRKPNVIAKQEYL